MGEEVALEFAATVTEAVAAIRELTTAAQELAAASKEASDSVARISAPATEAATATKEMADSSSAAAAGADEVGGALGKAAGDATAYADAVGRARDANGRFVSSAQGAAGAATEAAGAQKAAGDAAQGAAAKSSAAGDAAAAGGLGRYKMALVGVGVGAALAVDSAVKFQQQTTTLVTSAGEVPGQLGAVQQGLLQLSSQTGTSTKELAAGMYTVDSAGYHLANGGLQVLKAAAQGAKAENSDLKTVADAVSSAMVDYHVKASGAADVTTKLVAATSAGKTTFEELAASMPNILPIASAAHVSFSDILGDLASMTVHGMSAQQASDNLADAIKHMQAPTSVQSKELALLGLNANDLNASLQSKGLSGTINEISTRIKNLMPPGSQQVIAQMGTALQGLSPPVKQLGTELMNGTISMGDYNKAAKDLTGVQAGQASAFATLLKSTHQIGGAQVSGTEVLQNYSQAMYKAMGDATGLKVALMISGENAKTTAGAIQTVSGATVEAGNNVKGWGDVTKTTAFQLSKAKDSTQAAGIALGMTLLPAVNAVLVPLASFLSMIASNHAAAIAFAAVIGSVLAGALGIKLAKGLKEAKAGIEGVVHGIDFLVKKFTGAGEAAQASATVQETASAESAAAQEAKAGEVAVANEEAAATSSGSWVTAAARQVAAGAVWVAQSVARVAVVVASSVAGAATTAASWVASAAGQVASGALWVAQAIGKVALVVASNVAGAAVTAAAWIAANAVMLLGIGLVVALVVLAVVEIIKHWHTIAATAEEVWNHVYAFVSGIVRDVVDFVKSHWQLLLAILTGPIGLAVFAISKYWSDIEHGAEAVVNAIVGFFTRLPGEMHTIGMNIVHGLVNGIESMGSFLANSILNLIPSPIRSIVSSALGIFSPSTVFHGYGVNIVQGLVNGVASMKPHLQSAMGGLAGTVTGAGSAYAASAIGSPASSTHNFNVNVTGGQGLAASAYETPEFRQYLQGEVQEAVLRYDQLNPGNGLTSQWGRG